ncbi:cell division protein CrgA [Kineococcus sp. SYSU DK004]|uniref:cell division protein CrgA n=1 Tax=Kineococcus sp. SYSU DK004 TaxID=3383125 RepID=UPI003D7E0DFF
MPDSPLRRRKQRDATTDGADAATTPAGGASPAAAEGGGKPSRRDRRREEVVDDGSDRALAARNRLTPRWWVFVMLGLMLLGLVWIVVFYLTQARFPVPDIGNWNLVAGFGLVLVGFAMTTRWR